MQLRVVSSQARLNVIPIWGRDCAVLCNGRIWAGQQNYQRLRICGLAKGDEGLEGKWGWMWDCTTWSVSRSQWSGWLAPLENSSSNVLFNPRTKIYPERGLWVTQLFLLKKGKPNGQNSDDVSHHRQCEDRVWSWRNVPGFEMWWNPRSKCWVLKRLFTLEVHCSYS